jgi:hypothetical protein
MGTTKIDVYRCMAVGATAFAAEQLIFGSANIPVESSIKFGAALALGNAVSQMMTNVVNNEVTNLSLQWKSLWDRAIESGISAGVGYLITTSLDSPRDLGANIALGTMADTFGSVMYDSVYAVASS